ncbi:MAG TPA: cupin domain-containing protein [Bauldia sp.]|nr:cupin domain-containing protein [Bauldia sp.]
MSRKAAAFYLPLLLLAAMPALAEESAQYQNLLAPILQSSKTVLDQAIAYPAGTAKVTAAIVTIPPGGETGWHTHAVPLFVYILEGAVTVDYGDKGVKVYRAGEGILEAMDWPHDGKNLGDVPVKILAVYMGAEGATNTAAVPH